MDRPKLKVKSFDISKRLVFEAWERVRANRGAPGVDATSVAEFADKQRDNLYKLWNRMSAGSYMPGPVRAVEIPKDHGAGVRVLGVPNTVDRIAQTARVARRHFCADVGEQLAHALAAPVQPECRALHGWREFPVIHIPAVAPGAVLGISGLAFGSLSRGECHSALGLEGQRDESQRRRKQQVSQVLVQLHEVPSL